MNNKIKFLLLLKIILLKLQRVKIRNNIIFKTLKKISLRSPTINVTKRAITPKIILSQKTSYGFPNFYIDNYEFKR